MQLPGGAQEEYSIFVKAAEWWCAEHPKWFKTFAFNHCYLFDELDLLPPDQMECPLECTELHRRFMDEYEEMLEDFIAEEGSSMEEFVAEASRMLKGNQLTLIETNEHTDFLKTLMSSVEYYYFHNLLVNAARQQRGKGKKGKGGGRKGGVKTRSMIKEEEGRAASSKK
jgi:hypothetical protein